MLLELQHSPSRGVLKPYGWVIWKVQREQKCCSYLRHMFNVPAVKSLIISTKQCWQSIFSDGLWTLESNPSSIWTQAVGKLEKGWTIQPMANPNLIPTDYYLCSIRVADWTIATVLSNEILTRNKEQLLSDKWLRVCHKCNALWSRLFSSTDFLVKSSRMPPSNS